jgi:hypothetical protein
MDRSRLTGQAMRQARPQILDGVRQFSLEERLVRDARSFRIPPPIEHKGQQLAEDTELIASRADELGPAARDERVHVR